MDLDSENTIPIFHVAKGVLDLGLRSIRPSEEVVAHGQRPVVIENHIIILKSNLGPSLYRETLVLGADVVGRHEVRQGGIERWAELLVSGQGGFEQDRA